MLILGLLFPIVFGLVISLLISSEIAIPERIALAYGLGYGLLTLGMFLLNVLGIEFSLINTTVLLSGILVLSLVYLKRKSRFDYSSLRKLNPIQRKRSIRVPLSSFEIIMIVLLGFFALSNAVIAVYWPVHCWDSISTYDFRARVFAETKFIPEAALRMGDSFFLPWYTGVVFQYPPMTSLVHTWLYLSGWGSPKIFYPLLFISLATIFYSSLREYSPRYHSLLFTLILITFPFIYSQTTNALTNFPFAFYFSVGTLYLYRWVLTQKRGFLVLSSLLLGLSSWVRQESLVFFLGYLLILVAYSIPRRQFFAPVLFSLAYFSIESLWGIYTSNVLHIALVGAAMPRLLTALRRWHEIFDFMRWKGVAMLLWSKLASFRMVFYLGILVAMVYIDRIRRHRFLFLLVLSNLLLFGAGTYFLVTIHGWRPFAGAPARLFMTFLPTICYFVALITTERSFVPEQRLAEDGREKVL